MASTSKNNNSILLNIKKEKNVCGSSTAEHIHNSPYVTQPCNSIVKKEPEYLNSDNIEENTMYFSVKKLPNKNVSAIANDVNCEQRSQSDVVNLFICNICEMLSTTDRDSFSVHMASHSECSIHECFVCNEKFNSVEHWKDHMTNHQNLSKLYRSELLQSRTESRIRMHSNNSDTSMESEESESERENEFQNSSRNLITKKTKPTYSCNICFKRMPCELTLTAHLTLHSEPLHNESLNTELVDTEALNTKAWPFSCKFCGQKFTRERACTNHEKINHTLDKPFVVKSNKKNNISYCSLCNKTFGHKGALTNHMKKIH